MLLFEISRMKRLDALELVLHKKDAVQRKLFHVTFSKHWQVVADLQGKFWAPGVE